MHKLKPNDEEVLGLYSDFIFYILNDKEKSKIYKCQLQDEENSNKKQDYDLNLLNLDLNALNSTDEVQYIIISGQLENLGAISNISLGVCNLFGYSRNEIIGKNVELIMPEFYHKSHKDFLVNKIYEYRKSLFNLLESKKNIQQNFKDILAFGRNKSRYLIPFKFKVVYIPNDEENNSLFLAKISPETFQLGLSKQTQICFVMVNLNFIIQNFTSNSVTTLGLNSNNINNVSMDILKYIKEFQDEFSKFDLDDKTLENILEIKKNIVNKNLEHSKQIIWRLIDGNRNKIGENSDNNLNCKNLFFFI